jgi:5-methyltetrahydrofolate--homocysteine methyltransferase
MAMAYGLDAGIINPSSEAMMNAVTNSRALLGFDEGCAGYIEKNSEAEAAAVKTSDTDLKSAVKMGLKEEASQIAKALLGGGKAPLDVIDEFLIPALDEVGKDFENGKVFLPKLLMSAVSAGAAFDEVKSAIEASGTAQEKKGKILLATVKGDIHDIGKNIVKLLLENYGFDVIDLGKDVPPEVVVKTVIETKAKLVGLSALMTTTVPAMEETIKLLNTQAPWCKTVVGGAVLTQEYADKIGADKYAKDAMETVRFAEENAQ